MFTSVAATSRLWSKSGSHTPVLEMVATLCGAAERSWVGSQNAVPAPPGDEG